jgi:hypothetical protein
VIGGIEALAYEKVAYEVARAGDARRLPWQTDREAAGVHTHVMGPSPGGAPGNGPGDRLLG